jgi:hypothetical protein
MTYTHVSAFKNCLIGFQSFTVKKSNIRWLFGSSRETAPRAVERLFKAGIAAASGFGMAQDGISVAADWPRQPASETWSQSMLGEEDQPLYKR